MYKSKLQELCQKRAWHLPEYNIEKQGQDHNPRFGATVMVNGISFKSANPAKTSKEAQNAAAQVAFLHFTSPIVNPGSSSTTTNFEINTAEQMELQSQDQNTQADQDASMSKDDDNFKDMKHMYKNLLQVFAQKRNLNLPVYSCEFEGPPHASRFRCKVTINEQTFESLEFFRTIKEAEHAVAKIALSSLSPDAFQEEDFIFYKNLLQELTQKEGFPLPLYTTTRFGEAHSSTFISTVEVKCETFTGQQAKTKKQAEILVAKAAYMKLKECKSNRDFTITSPAHPEPHVPVLSSSNYLSNVNADTEQNAVLKACTSVNPSSTSSGEDQHRHKVSGTFSNFPPHLPSPQIEMVADWQNSSLSSGPYDPQPKDHLSTSNLTSTNLTLSTSTSTSNQLSTTNQVTDSTDSITKQPDASSSLFQNRVIVHSRALNIKVPAGSTILPMSDNEWVALRLDSQSHH